MKGSSAAAVILAIVIIFVIVEFEYNRAGFENFLFQVGSSTKNLIPSNVSVPTIENQTQPKLNETYVSNGQLVNYALQLINNDRETNGLSVVGLSNNSAAQGQAEDIMSTMQLSHWMTNGYKPYMTYTVYGGTGYVAQNVADSGYPNVSQCGIIYTCPPINPMSAIKSSEYQMMYNDSSSNWGHRDNILNPYHTNVSIGIAYDNYFFVIVQNFENDYVQLDNPVTQDGYHITISGNMSSGSVNEVLIYYDPTPTSETYQQNKNKTEYSFGNIVGGVVQPGYYIPNVTSINPQRWDANSPTIDIAFDMHSIETNPGVYTVVTWVDKNSESYPVTSYSIFVQ